MPLAVMFIRVGSVPRTCMAVYPMPIPASDDVVTDGVKLSIHGMSLPWFIILIWLLLMSE